MLKGGIDEHPQPPSNLAKVITVGGLLKMELAMADSRATFCLTGFGTIVAAVTMQLQTVGLRTSCKVAIA